MFPSRSPLYRPPLWPVSSAGTAPLFGRRPRTRPSRSGKPRPLGAGRARAGLAVARVDGNHTGPGVALGVRRGVIIWGRAARLDRRLADLHREHCGCLELLAVWRAHLAPAAGEQALEEHLQRGKLLVGIGDGLEGSDQDGRVVVNAVLNAERASTRPSRIVTVTHADAPAARRRTSGWPRSRGSAADSRSACTGSGCTTAVPRRRRRRVPVGRGQTPADPLGFIARPLGRPANPDLC